MRKIIAAILVLVMMLSMTACVPEDPKTVEITIGGVTEGAPISAATVEVTYGVETVAHEISWGVAKGDEIVDLGGLTEFGVGYYQLTVTYTLPEDAGEVPVVVSGGELTGTQALGDGKYAATFGYYFEGTPLPEPRLITITVTGAEKGANISDAAVSVTYGPIVLDSSITWGVAVGDELVAAEAGQTFGTGVYQATVTYTIPAELYPTDGEGIPVMCAAGQLGMTQALGNEQYSAQILFAFPGEEENVCEHSWMALPHTGTCTEGLVKHAVCSICGETQDHPEEPSEHSFDWQNAYVEEATCGAAGKQVLTCLVCGAVEEIPIEPSGQHNWVAQPHTGTCTEGLVKHAVCSVCGETQDRQEAPSEHSPDWTNATVEQPSCKGPGKRTAVCQVCGATVTEQFGSAGEHSWIAVPHTGTCTEGLVKHAVCSVCGETQDYPQPPSNHYFDWDNATMEPAGCNTAGKRTATCLICGVTAEEIIPPTGKHNYKINILGGHCEKGLNVEYVCTECGHSYKDVMITEHSWGKGEYWNNHTHKCVCIYCGTEGFFNHRLGDKGYCSGCDHYIVN